MKKYVLLFWLTGFYAQILFGQNPFSKQWDYRYGGDSSDFAYRIVPSADGGFLLCGSSSSGISGDKTQANWDSTKVFYDYWIVKTDQLGIIIWDKRFGGDKDDEFTCVDNTTDGGYIIGGISKSSVSGDKTQPNWDTSCSLPNMCAVDYWIVKIDSLGNKQWDRTFGTIFDDFLYSIRQTKDGGYILGGATTAGIDGDKTQASKGNYDYWIVKTDEWGVKQWDKDFGGSSFDFMDCLELTSDGGYLLGGVSYSDSSGDKTQNNCGNGDFWLIKIDSLGNKLWDKGYGGSNYDHLYTIKATNDYGFILGGYSSSISSCEKTQTTWGDMDYWIIKIDSAGNKQWDRDFGGTNLDYLLSIMQIADGGFLLGGVSYSGISGDKSESNLSQCQSWIIKTDSLGIKQWDKTLGTISIYGDDAGRAIQSADGCFIILNSSSAGIGGDKTQPNRDTSNLTYDFWLIKFCYSTSFFTCSDTAFCDKQYIDFYDQSTNNPTSWQWLFPGGVPSSSTLQNPVGIYYNSYGSFDVTLIACNASGCDTLFLPGFINEFPPPPIPAVTWVSDTLFSTPSFTYQWYFNSSVIPGATGQYYVFQQPGDYFVIVTDSNGCSTPSSVLYTGIDEAVNNGGIYVIPNPTDGEFVLYGAKVNSVVKIYDVAGRELYSGIIKSSQQQISFKALAGVYILEIAKSDRFVRMKIVVRN